MATVNTNPPVEPTYDLLGLTKREIFMIKTCLGRTNGNAKDLQPLYTLLYNIPDVSGPELGLKVSVGGASAPRFDEANS